MGLVPKRIHVQRLKSVSASIRLLIVLSLCGEASSLEGKATDDLSGPQSKEQKLAVERSEVQPETTVDNSKNGD